jgi:SAM-dependent methyltransferase
MNAVQTPQADELRRRSHANWESVAPGWGRHAEFLDGRAEPLTARMLEVAKLQPDDRVLDLAAGPGGLGLLAARHAGSVVISDIAPGMIAIASARAEAAGLANVQTRVLDLEAIDEPDGSFDVVLARDGLMLVPDPARAAAEIRRVGGRFVVAVWGAPERNPWLSTIFRVVTQETGIQVPPPGVPGPFSLSDPDRLRAVLGEGVAVDEVSVPYRAGSFDEWFSRSAALAGPLAQRLASLPAPVLEGIRAKVREAASEYVTADGIEFPGVGLVAAG